MLEIPQSANSEGESDHLLQILENLKVLDIREILEILAVKDPFCHDPLFRSTCVHLDPLGVLLSASGIHDVRRFWPAENDVPKCKVSA